jgi:transcriptional regulator with XRE-family HTH domain
LIQIPPEEIAELCGVSRATALRWQRGKARAPAAAAKLIALRLGGVLDPHEEHRESSRTRAIKLRARMLQFNDVYGAAWFVRMAQHGAPDYRRQKIQAFMEVLRRALNRCGDEEALIYAVADALTAYPNGLPWEGGSG